MSITNLDSLRLAAPICVDVAALPPFHRIIREAGIESEGPRAFIVGLIASVDTIGGYAQLLIAVARRIQLFARVALPLALLL